MTTKWLAQRFAVVGVDISQRQIQLARQSVPGAKFLWADMTKLKFPSDSFDGVTAFYSITHVPREQHASLLASIHRWLRPGGIFVGSMSAGALPGAVEDWLGTPMYFSSYDSETNLRLVTEAGLEVLSSRHETAVELGGWSVTFLWIVGQKPAAPT